MTIEFYFALSYFLIILIYTLEVLSISNRRLILFVFIILIISSAFRADNINDDALNYSFYFNNVFEYDSLSELLNAYSWQKIEIGFKVFVYTISRLFIKETIVFKLSIALVSSLIFVYLFKSWKYKHNASSTVFIYFYTCYFFIVNNLAIIRFSVASMLALAAMNLFFNKDKNSNYIGVLLLIIAGTFHLSVVIFSGMFFYFYFFYSKKYSYIFLVLPFIFIPFSTDLLLLVTSKMSSYYGDIAHNIEHRFSFRYAVELLVFIFILVENRKRDAYQLFLFSFFVYLFFLLFEMFLGIGVLNRMRILSWMMFLFLLSYNWKLIRKRSKIIIIAYSLFFFISLSIVTPIAWKEAIINY